MRISYSFRPAWLGVPQGIAHSGFDECAVFFHKRADLLLPGKDEDAAG